MTAAIRFTVQGKQQVESALTDITRRVQTLEAAWQRFNKTASGGGPGGGGGGGGGGSAAGAGGGGAGGSGRLEQGLRQMQRGRRTVKTRRMLGFGMQAAGAFGIGNGTQRFFQGVNTAYDRDIQAGELGKGIKDVGQSLDDFKRSILDSGKALGTTNDAIMQLATNLSAVTGKVNDFGTRLYDIQAGGMRLGLTQQQSNSFFIGEAAAGVTTGRTLTGRSAGLSDKQLTGDIAEAITSGNMQGRQAELVESLQTLTRQIQGVTVDAPNSLNLLGLMTTLNQSGIQGLQGTQGAAVLSRINQGIQNPGGNEAGTALEYRAMVGNGAPISYSQFLYNREAGLDATTTDGRSLFGAMLEQVNGMPGSQYDHYAMLSQEMGTSLHQSQGVLQQFIGPDGKFNVAKMTDVANMVGGTGNLKNYDTTVVGLLGELASGKAKTTDVAQEANSELGLNIPLDASQADIIAALKGTGTKLTASETLQKDENDLAKNAEDLGNSFVGFKKGLLELTNALGPLGIVAQMVGGTMLMNGGLNILGGGGGGGGILNIAKNILGGGGTTAATDVAETAATDVAAGAATDVAAGAGAGAAGSAFGSLFGADTLGGAVATGAMSTAILGASAYAGGRAGDLLGMAVTGGQGVSVYDPQGAGTSYAQQHGNTVGQYAGMSRDQVGQKLTQAQNDLALAEKYEAALQDANGGEERRMALTTGIPGGILLNVAGVGRDDAALKRLGDLTNQMHKFDGNTSLIADAGNSPVEGDRMVQELIAALKENTKQIKTAYDAAPDSPTPTSQGSAAATAQAASSPFGMMLARIADPTGTGTGTGASGAASSFDPSSVLTNGVASDGSYYGPPSPGGPVNITGAIPTRPNFPPEVIKAAMESQIKYGVPASVTLAQWALESAYGKAMPTGSNNPFGIKWNGKGAYVEEPTQEQGPNGLYWTTAKFQKYNSLADAFDAHAALLANGSPYQGIKKDMGNASQYANDLTGIYATSTSYGADLNRLMSQYNLTGIDAAARAQQQAAATPTISQGSSGPFKAMNMFGAAGGDATLHITFDPVTVDLKSGTAPVEKSFFRTQYPGIINYPKKS